MLVVIVAVDAGGGGRSGRCPLADGGLKPVVVVVDAECAAGLPKEGCGTEEAHWSRWWTVLLVSVVVAGGRRAASMRWLWWTLVAVAGAGDRRVKTVVVVVGAEVKVCCCGLRGRSKFAHKGRDFGVTGVRSCRWPSRMVQKRQQTG